MYWCATINELYLYNYYVVKYGCRLMLVHFTAKESFQNVFSKHHVLGVMHIFIVPQSIFYVLTLS